MTSALKRLSDVFQGVTSISVFIEEVKEKQEYKREIHHISLSRRETLAHPILSLEMAGEGGGAILSFSVYGQKHQL